MLFMCRHCLTGGSSNILAPTKVTISNVRRADCTVHDVSKETKRLPKDDDDTRPDHKHGATISHRLTGYDTKKNRCFQVNDGFWRSLVDHPTFRPSYIDPRGLISFKLLHRRDRRRH
jgi:hypothetical protein